MAVSIEEQRASSNKALGAFLRLDAIVARLYVLPDERRNIVPYWVQTRIFETSRDKGSPTLHVGPNCASVDLPICPFLSALLFA